MSSSRRVSVGIELSDGGFFDGDRFGSQLELRLRPNRYVRSETSFELNEVDLPGGSFTTRLIRERLSLSFSPNLTLNTLVQYNDSSDVFAINVRLNWIYRPGADLFVVYNQSWDAADLGALVERDRQLLVKFTYPMDF